MPVADVPQHASHPSELNEVCYYALINSCKGILSGNSLSFAYAAGSIVKDAQLTRAAFDGCSTEIPGRIFR